MPSDTRGLEPPIAISGAASIQALATPVSMLSRRAPSAAMQTPGLARQARLRMGHHRRRLLVPGVDHSDAEPDQLASVSSIGPPIR